MENITNVLVAFGSGSIISTAMQYFFNERAKRKSLFFQEKKEAFVGLLEAYHKAAVAPSDSNSKAFAYWQMRCELICSAKTKLAIQNIVDTNGKSERPQAHEDLKQVMVADLRNSI